MGLELHLGKYISTLTRPQNVEADNTHFSFDNSFMLINYMVKMPGWILCRPRQWFLVYTIPSTECNLAKTQRLIQLL